ncbi:signal peptidase I [Thermodesulfobacteriota bacterium]
MKKKKNEIEPTVEPAEEKSNRRVFQEYSEAFVVAVILAIIIRAFCVQAFKIPSSSMEPTLLIGDHILVNKFIYGIRVPFTKLRWPVFRDPARGDVIVFVYPEDRTKDFIKRVVAIPGDTIEIDDKRVVLNGEVIEEPFAVHRDRRVLVSPGSPRDYLPPMTIPKDKLFVMGDNRDHSHDSRYWKFVPVEDVKGNAFLIYYSAARFPKIRWDRLFKVIR